MTNRLQNQKRNRSEHFWIHAFLLLMAALFLLPVLLVVSASLTDERTLSRSGYSLIPVNFSLEAYRYIFADPTQMVRAYGVTALVSVVGSLLSLVVMAMLAYPLSRRDFQPRTVLSFVVFFTLLFNGGLVASYVINTRYLGLSDSLAALVLPYLVVPFYVLLLRTYFASLPGEILEAARIDGASEWTTFIRIVLPLSTPALATVGLFSLLLYWNDYFLGLLYLNSREQFPLQLLLFNILNNISFLANSSTAQTSAVAVPTESVRMAMAVLATGPIGVVFLYLQRYFVQGVTLGSLKG
jgi:putative aldouronate transport system permease protein